MDQADGPGTVRNPYEVLGVSPDASPEEIRDAYWRLVHFHRLEGETAWMPTHLEEIQSAYEVLSDPARRAELDAANGGFGSATAAPPAQSEPSALPFPPPEPSHHRSRNPIDRLFPTSIGPADGHGDASGASRTSLAGRVISRASSTERPS